MAPEERTAGEVLALLHELDQRLGRLLVRL